MKKFKKGIVVTLLLAIVVGVVNVNGFLAKASEYDEVNQIQADGQEYTISSIATSDGKKVQVVNDETKTKYEIKVSNDLLDVVVNEYEYAGKNIFGYDKFKKVNEKKYNNNQSVDKEFSAQFSWASKKYDGWDGDYWYQTGASSYGNKYIQIGNVASYRIKYWKLSSEKKKECDSYINKIKESRKKATTFGVSCIGAYVSGGAIIAIVAAMASAPVAIIVAAITAAVGASSSAAKAAVDCYYLYEDIEDLYAIIKTYHC